MVQGSRQVQTQAQQQVQTLSPQQILAVKLLELPTLELEERIHAELLDNPALEEGKETSDASDALNDEYNTTDQDGEPNTDSGEDIELGDYRTEDDIPDYKCRRTTAPKKTGRKTFLSQTTYLLRNAERTARHATPHSGTEAIR